MLRIALMFLTNFFRLPYLIFMLYWMSNPKHNYSKEERYAFLHKYVVPINKGGRVKIEYDGLENLPAGNGFILFPNHQGLYDVLTMLQTFDRPFSVVVKKETQKVFLLNRVLKMLDAEFMDREDVRQSLKIIQSVSARVKAGENFIIFPEGTRSKRGNRMNAFKPGAFKSATMAHAPIVPVALIDCFVPFDSHSIRKTTVQMHILPPLYYDDYKDSKTPEIAALVSGRIKEKIAAIRPETALPDDIEKTVER